MRGGAKKRCARMREVSALRGSRPARRARACAILAISWREDVPLPDVVWAAGELLGPAFTARLPQARPAHECL